MQRRCKHDVVVVQRVQTAVETRHGVEGFRDTQDAIENISTMKSEFDHQKGQTLENMSDMVQQFDSKIANKKAALEPIIRELRSVRQKAQVAILIRRSFIWSVL